MHVLALALVLAAPPAIGAAEPAGPVAAPQAVSPPAPVAPVAVVPPLPTAAIEKMGQGDRAFLARDYRTALFAYQDAVYLAPRNPAPRVKLARAYLALRYPTQALAQAEQALALEPGNVEALSLAEEAKSPAAARTAAVPVPSAPAPAPAAGGAGAPPPGPRVFRYVPEPEPPAAGTQPAPRPPSGQERSAPPASPAPPPASPVAPAEPTGGGPARQRYRAALDHLQNREFEKAVSVLSDALALDPRLAVAYAARASARFGLGKYREAADDYRAAIGLDQGLGTPLYGLAECHRALGQTKDAAEMYRRYADSRASDVRDDLRVVAARRAQDLQ
jgi:tetratricopeptide (TPR) repeat protein